MVPGVADASHDTQHAEITQLMPDFVAALVAKALSNGVCNHLDLQAGQVLRLAGSAIPAKSKCILINVQGLDVHEKVYLSRRKNGYCVVGLRKRAVVHEEAYRTSWRADLYQLNPPNNRGQPFLLHRLLMGAGGSQLVRHRCPGGVNEECLNPDHMAFGSQKTNRKDRDQDASFERVLRSSKVCGF